jgi:hypothetical protein
MYWTKHIFIYLILINKYENMNDKKNLDLQNLKFNANCK